MDDLTKGFLEHYQKTHPGMPIKYFDASEGLHISQFNSVDNPALPPKTLYKDFPPHESEKPMSEIRDTHFQNAAKLLVEKTMATKAMDTVDATRFLNDDDLAELQTLFAHFAYDLFYHVMEHAQDEVYYPPEQWLGHVPDLTAWPNTSPEAP